MAPTCSDEAKGQTFKRFGDKIGRNDPCPCGSGKKYKQCHGKLALTRLARRGPPMPVNLRVPRPDELRPVAGVELGYAEAGIRKPGRKDLLVMRSPKAARWPACSRRTASAPRRCWCARSTWPATPGIRALVVNTGNANAGTGEAGPGRRPADLRAPRAPAGRATPKQVLPFSTGVIMEPLPVERLVAGLPQALARLRPDGWFDAAARDHDHRHRCPRRPRAV